MEERGGGGGGGLLGFVVRQSSSRASGSPRPSVSRSGSKISPPLRRLSSGGGRTPRRDGSRSSSSSSSSTAAFRCFRNNIVFWLILITLWAYIGFLVQSRWAHHDRAKAEFVGYKSEPRSVNARLDASAVAAAAPPPTAANATLKMHLPQPKKGRRGVKSAPRRPERRLRRVAKPENRTGEMGEGMMMMMMMLQRRNASYGAVVGPFGKTEDEVLGWSAEKRKGTCDRKGAFARLVWSRSFLLVFHEVSMTGAPLSMLELGTEILSCGGSVSAVVLSRKGGLLGEIERRGIKVLADKAAASYKTAMKKDLVIAGSAVCSSWIEQYLSHNPAGSGQLVWWIMENRREYFDRSKDVLNRVKMLAFLSDSQSKQWLSWCQEENIKLNSERMIVPLSVNDELAFVAGIPCSLNTPAFSIEKMLEKKDLLRSTIRKEMGLNDNEMLVVSLSSINPGKGQRLLLESALLVSEHNVSFKDPKSFGILEERETVEVTPQNESAFVDEFNKGYLMKKTNQTGSLVDDVHQSNVTNTSSKKKKKKNKKKKHSTKMLSSANHTKILTGVDQQKRRILLSESESKQKQILKVLIGSVGSKSNKVLYVKSILRFLSQHSNLSKSVLWTPATTRVASLYAAADVYVINAQGLGETFGRVTIEAMAFGLPILGTDAGGTPEIVEKGITGLLHPPGREGIMDLAQNIQYMLNNPSMRKKMGNRGRLKVQNMYLKHHMYQRFAEVLAKCLKPK